MGIKYDKVNIKLHGYSNFDWVGSPIECKSTSRCCFSLGSRMVSWFSRKQSSVALSSTKAEYIASSLGAREVVWIRKLLAYLFKRPLNPTMIHCDNQSCIKLSTNPVFHNCSKHIEIPYHYIRDMVDRGVIQLEYSSTNEKTTYIFTKPLAKVKLEYFKEKLCMIVILDIEFKFSIYVCLCFYGCLVASDM